MARALKSIGTRIERATLGSALAFGRAVDHRPSHQGGDQQHREANHHGTEPAAAVRLNASTQRSTKRAASAPAIHRGSASTPVTGSKAGSQGTSSADIMCCPQLVHSRHLVPPI